MNKAGRARGELRSALWVREDWTAIATDVNDSIALLRTKPDKFKAAIQLTPDGILNAYREGDISFEDAVGRLTLRVETKPPTKFGDWCDAKGVIPTMARVDEFVAEAKSEAVLAERERAEGRFLRSALR